MNKKLRKRYFNLLQRKKTWTGRNWTRLVSAIRLTYCQLCVTPKAVTHYLRRIQTIGCSWCYHCVVSLSLVSSEKYFLWCWCFKQAYCEWYHQCRKTATMSKERILVPMHAGTSRLNLKRTCCVLWQTFI